MLKVIFNLLFILAGFVGCKNIAGDCGKTVVKRAVAPNGKLQATRIRIDCGATTTPSSSIRIILGNDTTDLGYPENTVVSEGAGTDFYWQTNDSLVITGADTVGGNFMKNEFLNTKTNKIIKIVYHK